MFTWWTKPGLSGCFSPVDQPEILPIACTGRVALLACKEQNLAPQCTVTHTETGKTLINYFIYMNTTKNIKNAIETSCFKPPTGLAS